jgi:hypothetical protein
MHSKLAMALASFGTIFLSFGGVIVVIGLLGIRYGSRDAMGGAGAVALGFLIAGAILAGASYMIGRSDKTDNGSRA